MKKSTLYLKAITNLVIYLCAALLIIFFLPKVIKFFMPFVIGLIVSAIANPAAKFFEEKIRFKRKASSAVLIVLLIAIIIFAGYGIIAFLITQGIGFVGSIIDKWDDIQKTLDSIGRSFNSFSRNLPSGLTDSLNDFGANFEDSLANFISGLASADTTSSVMSGISTGIGSLANILIGAIMCVLSAYFFTAEHNSLAEGLKKMLPETAYGKFDAALRGLKNAVGGYFKAQLQIEFWVYIVTVIGLLILRIDYAVVIALGIGILDFLPFFGAGIIMVPWGVIAIFNGDYWLAAGMFITWGVGQIVRQLIQPKIVGNNVGIAPLPTLVLLFVGYKVIGMFGMIIAVPIAMIFISLYKEGLFVNLIRSIRILWDAISSFRRLPNSTCVDNIDSVGREGDTSN